MEQARGHVAAEFVATGTAAQTSQPPELAAVLREIRQRRAALELEGVQHVSVFGSVARGDAREDSDVDVLVDKAPGARFSLFNLVGVQEILQEALNRKVDVMTRETLMTSRIRKNVEPDIVRAF